MTDTDSLSHTAPYQAALGGQDPRSRFDPHHSSATEHSDLAQVTSPSKPLQAAPGGCHAPWQWHGPELEAVRQLLCSLHAFCIRKVSYGWRSLDHVVYHIRCPLLTAVTKQLESAGSNVSRCVENTETHPG